MPTYQDSLEEVFPPDQVQVIALNGNAPSLYWLNWYVNLEGLLPGTNYTKPDTLTYPMIYDTTQTVFTAYEANTLENPLPCIFLIDQAGKIRLRSNGASEEPLFLPEFTAIMDSIRGLLDNPPSH
jgi:alkyl hydroperoxide reductase subunit AhpC